MEVHRHSHTSGKKWDELANLTAMGSFITRMTHLVNLQQQLNQGRNLIMVIKKEYHLK